MTWPKRHLQRCGLFWQMSNALDMCHKVSNEDKWYQQSLKGPLPTFHYASGIGLRYWTEHEVKEFAIIENKLKELYKNRYTSYKEMVAQENIDKNN